MEDEHKKQPPLPPFLRGKANSRCFKQGVTTRHFTPRLLITLLIICVGLLSPTFARAGEGPVTPYGGYCKDCAVYGACKEAIPPHEAIQSLSKYYKERGYRLGNVVHKGRFIEAQVLQNSKQVDKVIFDRKTGRLRSMY
ncbi:MAG: hypothetical protein Q8K68_08715 [Nitrospirota bacterium]|nr:hypothetical protein [Nitrospirota bacterium]